MHNYVPKCKCINSEARKSLSYYKQGQNVGTPQVNEAHVTHVLVPLKHLDVNLSPDERSHIMKTEGQTTLPSLLLPPYPC